MGRAAKLLHFMWSSIRNRVTQIRFIVFTESFKKIFGCCLPGTVSGNVSFCIVCIAFRAFRARYHLGLPRSYI